MKKIKWKKRPAGCRRERGKVIVLDSWEYLKSSQKEKSAQDRRQGTSRPRQAGKPRTEGSAGGGIGMVVAALQNA